MKLKRSTQGLLLAALLLGVGVAVYEGTIKPDRQAQTTRSQRLLSIASTDIQRMTITTADRTLEFERLDEAIEIPSEEDGQFTLSEWQWVRPTLDASDAPETPENSEDLERSAEANEPETQEPQKTQKTQKKQSAGAPIPARQAYIDYLLTELERLTSDRSLSAPANRRSEYGLEPPTLTVTIELNDGSSHRLELGQRDFTGTFIYALLDSPADATELDVLLLSPSVINAFDRELDDWDATVPLESAIELPDPAIDNAPLPTEPPTEPPTDSPIEPSTAPPNAATD